MRQPPSRGSRTFPVSTDWTSAYNTLKPCTEPPFGVEWKTQQKTVMTEHEQRGHAGQLHGVRGAARLADGARVSAPVAEGASDLVKVTQAGPSQGSMIEEWKS